MVSRAGEMCAKDTAATVIIIKRLILNSKTGAKVTFIMELCKFKHSHEDEHPAKSTCV